jgi:cardiolipin-specific phospholipase
MLPDEDRVLNEVTIERMGETVENNLVHLHGYGGGRGILTQKLRSNMRMSGR